MSETSEMSEMSGETEEVTEITGTLSGPAQTEQFQQTLAMALHDAQLSGKPRFLIWSINAQMWRAEALRENDDLSQTLSYEPELIVYPDGRIWPYWADGHEEDVYY